MAELKTAKGTVIGLIPEELLSPVPPVQAPPAEQEAPKKRASRKKAEIKPESVLDSIETID